MTTTTKLEQNQEQAREYLNKILGTRYTWWKSGHVPERGPAWAKNGPPPSPAEIREEGCFCAGVPTLARRVLGLPVPTLGNPNYDGGICAYFGSASSAAPIFPRRGYFDVHGRERRFDLEEARRPWTLIGRKFRDAYDQGHAAIVLPNGKVLQSYPAAGVNDDITLERSHAGGYYEVMVRAEDWLLPFDYEDEKPGDSHEEPHEEPLRPGPREDQPKQPEREVVLFTTTQLSEISGNTDLAALEKDRSALIPEMRKAGITTPPRMSAFLGNVCQETDHLRTLREYDNASGTYLRSKRYYPYYGRGYLQNTWKDAYERLGRVLGVDLVRNPDLLAANRSFAARAAVWFWEQHDLNSYADRGEFKKVCAIINTGSPNGEPNGMADRLAFYDRAKRVLAKETGGAGASRNGCNHDGRPYINLAAVGQADETLAFALAMEIRKAGIGVTVTNGRDNVQALAARIYKEPMGYRQMWIIGGPALDACGEYAEYARWPPGKTDYYDLAGKSMTGTCHRAAELADEKAREGVGRKFLQEMGVTGPTAEKAPAPAQRDEVEEPEPEGDRKSDYRRGRHESQDRESRSNQEPEARGNREERRGGQDEPAGSVERLADEELEEIGRKVLQLVSSVRSHNGRSKMPRTEPGAHEEGD